MGEKKGSGTRKKIEDAIKELKFIDEPDLDVGLLAKISLPGCTKHCEGGHCGGQAPDCRKQRICDDKCLQLGDCVKQSGSWCSQQSDPCEDKGQCRNKCMIRGIPVP